jgi:hypothetical protein
MKPNVAELRRGGALVTEAAGLSEGRGYWGVDYELGDPAQGGGGLALAVAGVNQHQAFVHNHKYQPPFSIFV